jgi:hypothetical protein
MIRQEQEMDHVGKGLLQFADVVGSCLCNMAYMELFLLFVWLSRVLGTSTYLGGTTMVGSRGACT